jgi:alpha-amylase/alpha-mannosidase (GH57 family)
MPDRYICIHGHFYQPPRENPWLEAIEVQDSAYPYHDWNERISAECYGPNSASRIMDGEGRIQKIVNNYSRISFNIGPTLLMWFHEKAPDVYRAILAADQNSQKLYSGHGSAMAQAYNHMIMPLANSRDKETQVIWGICDFEYRYGRKPEGMWLPETAVDLETLDILAQHGIKFTVLSPYQAWRVRPIGARNWRDTSGGRIDPSVAYRMRLRYGRWINVFFYDGPISRGVAFEGLLASGEKFANRLLGVFAEDREGPQMVHIATDGETYGHHHPYGDMALAYALDYIDANESVNLTNYAEFLERHPPAHEAKIFEKSSWSCVHGVERWRSDCGCNSGGHQGWNQKWRAPLREALDWLRDIINSSFARKGKELFKDPWAARNDYINVILDRSPESVQSFLDRNTPRSLSPEETTRALKFMELQRHLMLMYTSCGWFFDELSGIETVQVIQYAGRAIQLAEEILQQPFEARFIELLEKAESNIPAHKNGAVIFEKFVRFAAIDLPKVGAHYAVSSLFEPYNHETQIYCYNVERRDYKVLNEGTTRLALGRVRIASQITWESAEITFGVLHLGDHNLDGGVRRYMGESEYAGMVKEITESFDSGDLAERLRTVEKHFGSVSNTLMLLFRDQQHHILRLILQSALTESEAAYRKIYERGAPLMRFVTSLGMSQPKSFQIAAEFTLNAELRGLLESETLNVDQIGTLLEEMRRAGVATDEATLEFSMRKHLERIAALFLVKPDDIDRLRTFNATVDVADMLPFKVRLWQPQNVFHRVLLERFEQFQNRAAEGDGSAKSWVELFLALGNKLSVYVGQE